MRADLEIIKHWIDPDSRVLDLGCGDGSALSFLKNEKNIFDTGLEIDSTKINQCLQAGINVLEQNLNNGLANFETNSFDTILLTQTLQAVQHPDLLIEDMLRVGKSCIITFPNFAYWRYRFFLLTNGRMPISKSLPHTWYDTPNIHFCTISDFDDLCKTRKITVSHRIVVDAYHHQNTLMNIHPNLFGINAIYHISG